MPGFCRYSRKVADVYPDDPHSITTQMMPKIPPKDFLCKPPPPPPRKDFLNSGTMSQLLSQLIAIIAYRYQF